MTPSRDQSGSTKLIDDNVRQILSATQDSLHDVVKAAANSVYAAGFNNGLDDAVEVVGQWQRDQQTSTELPNLIRIQSLEGYSQGPGAGDGGDDFLSNGVAKVAERILNVLWLSELTADKQQVASDWLQCAQVLGHRDGLEGAVEVVNGWHQEKMTSTNLPQKIRDHKMEPLALSDVEVTGWTPFPIAPWRRYFARMFDITIIGFISFFLILLVIGIFATSQFEILFDLIENQSDLFINIFGGIVIVLFSLPITGLLIGLTGYSPGKWLFGVRVVSRNGKPIGVITALKRELNMWIVGLGLGIFVVTFITQFVAYQRLTKKKATEWDEKVGTVVLHRPSGESQNWLMALSFAIYLAVLAGASLLD